MKSNPGRIIGSTGTHDPIFQQLVALNDGTTQFILVSTDILMSLSAYDTVAEKVK